MKTIGVMDGKKFKEIAGRIPDNATVIKVCERYIAWRNTGGKICCYSFHPENLDEDIK